MATRKFVDYVDFVSEGAFCERLLTLAAGEGINIINPRKKGYQMTGTVFAGDYKKLRKPAKTAGLRLKIVKKHGISFFLKRNRKKIGFAAGTVGVMLIVLALNMCIWKVNVIGNEKVPTQDIIAAVEEKGLTPGSLRKKHVAREISWHILNQNDGLAWVTVNIQGCVANIVVTEVNEETEMKYDDDKPVNIVASKYGVIRSMDVFDGQDVVKVGDAVMKGDLLVSAVYEDRYNKLTLKHARAKIMAETDYSITVEFPMEQVISEKNGIKKEVGEIRVLGLKIKYGSDKNCEGLPFETDEKDLYFFWLKLPISVKNTRYFAVKEKTVTYNMEQSKSGAYGLLEEKEKIEMADMEIVSKKVEEKVKDGKYILKADYICLMDIAEEQDILSDVPWENTDDMS